VNLITEQIINGIITGSMYALMASGLTLVWGTMNMLNLAHGEFYMLSGFFMFFLNVSSGLHWIVSALISLILLFIVAVIIEKVMIERLMKSPGFDESHLIATFGLSLFLQNLSLALWGEKFKNIPYYIEGKMHIFNSSISIHRILILIVAILIITLLGLFLKYGRFGRALRATSQEQFSAIIYGINTKKTYMITFGISAILAAIAGIMLSPINSVNPWMGADPLLKSLAVVVIGGLGSLAGAIIAGVSLGIIEGLSILVFSSEWENAIAFTLLILFLWIKPTGIFGQKNI